MPEYFSDNATRSYRAAQIWQILVSKAYNRQTATYGEIAELLGYKGAGVLDETLGHILHYCRQEGLPPLTVLVVNQGTGLPGQNLTEDMNAAREDVYNYWWYDVIPPSPDELSEAFQSRSR